MEKFIWKTSYRRLSLRLGEITCGKLFASEDRPIYIVSNNCYLMKTITNRMENSGWNHNSPRSVVKYLLWGGSKKLPLKTH